MINQYELTKKELGRINSALNQSRLNIFDTEEGIKSRRIGEIASGSMTRCTADIKRALDVFLCSTQTNPEYRKLFSTIDTKGIESVSSICSNLDQNPKALDSVAIRTVFGGTEKMPFRALAYLLPALNMCEELVNTAGISEVPNIEYYFMNGAGIITNALDPERANSVTAEFIKIARKYIEEYHPSLKDKVNFYVDTTFSSSIIQTPEYRQMHKVLEEKLLGENELKSDLVQMGERRKKANNSIKYAALHTFVHDGYINPEVARMSNFFGGTSPEEYSTIISIGAKPEEKFYKARKLLSDEVKGISYFSPVNTAQYIANINVPPYSPLPSGELYLSDVLSNPSTIMMARRNKEEFSEYQTPVQKAVESILTDIARSDSCKDIFEFIEEIKKIEKDKGDFRK